MQTVPIVDRATVSVVVQLSGTHQVTAADVESDELVSVTFGDGDTGASLLGTESEVRAYLSAGLGHLDRLVFERQQRGTK